MSGFWELQSPNKVLCAILHTDDTTIAWAFGLRNLVIPGHLIGLAGMPYDHARNAACQQTLQGGFEHVFFLDSDVVPPHDAILRLLSHNKPFISGLYCRRSPPHGVPVMMKNGSWVTHFRPGKLLSVDLVGAGCLLIHRSVLEALAQKPHRPGKPWFDWKVDMQGIEPPGDCMSEDFTLCKRVREQLGIPVLVDTSIQCRHIGHAQATYGNFTPCDAVPIT